MKAYFVALTFLTALIAIAVTLAVAQNARSVQTGVYTAAQAETGEKVFVKDCGDCHSPEEFSGPYMEGWAGQTALALVDAIAETMPVESPGSLKTQEFVDIVAYLFKFNGLPTGETKMDNDAAKDIFIEGPFGAQSAEDPGSKGAKPQ